MEKIPVSQLLKELKELDPRVEIVPNPRRPGLSNIKIDGEDICPIPSDFLQTERTPDYVYRFPNDYIGTHRTYGEAKEYAIKIIEALKDKSFSEEFFDKDEK